MPEFLNTHETFMNAFVCPYSVANETIFSSVVPLMFNHLPPGCNVWINEKKKKKKEMDIDIRKNDYIVFSFFFHVYMQDVSCKWIQTILITSSIDIFFYVFSKIIIWKSFANWSIISTSTATLCGTLLFSLLPAYKIPSIPKNHSDNLAT